MPINQVFVEGFKSLKERTTVELRDLTILAGANSSGKSSLIQPLLLLKQTLQAGYDPGPLLINGPNVVFSKSDQMFWSAHGEPRADRLTIGLGVSASGRKVAVETVLRQQKNGPPPFAIELCTWTIMGQSVVLKEKLPSQEIEETLKGFSERGNAPSRRLQTERLDQIFGRDEQGRADALTIKRTRAFLGIYLNAPYNYPYFPTVEVSTIEREIRRIIHVPGLRGNPRRTYQVTAVEGEFPGLFQEYVASVIAHWEKGNKAKLEQLGRDLAQLGLTWKVTARQQSDTEVELLVGRVSSGRRGGDDLVSIADVGFGLSQSLPVAVALLTAEAGQLVYLEQPEIHLHPRAQLGLAELLCAAVKRKVQVVVETHSELLLLGIQRLIATGELPQEKALLYWLHRNEMGMTQIEQAKFDGNGAFGNVPIDFSDVSLMAMRDYLDAVAEGV